MSKKMIAKFSSFFIILFILYFATAFQVKAQAGYFSQLSVTLNSSKNNLPVTIDAVYSRSNSINMFNASLYYTSNSVQYIPSITSPFLTYQMEGMSVTWNGLSGTIVLGTTNNSTTSYHLGGGVYVYALYEGMGRYYITVQ